MSSSLGAFSTPPDVADFLTRWAIRSPEDDVLDLGIGDGTFVFSSFFRLRELGAKKIFSARQIFGCEIENVRYEAFQAKALDQKVNFPNLRQDDFFGIDYPFVDAIVGNPPYVRRRAISEQRIKEIRSSVLERNLALAGSKLSKLSDLYVYFILKAATYLKTNGRMAVILADSWLNSSSGEALRRYLKSSFRIEQLISFEDPVFSDAQVKSVLLLAVKRADSQNDIAFTRVQKDVDICELHSLIKSPNKADKKLKSVYVNSTELDTSRPWGKYFKISDVNAVLQTITGLEVRPETRFPAQADSAGQP